MFNSREKDRLHKRNIELARQVRDLSHENKALYEENKVLRYDNEVSTDLINRIIKLANANKYNNEEVFINRIKELIRENI